MADQTCLILQSGDNSAVGSSDAFLDSKLKYVTDKNGQKICSLEVDGEDVGVMMGWEKTVMQQTVEKLCRDHPKRSNLKILNVGFGLGIVCTFWSISRLTEFCRLDRYIVPGNTPRKTCHN